MTDILTPTRRTGIYFFAQFVAGGTGNAFAGIWFSQQGLTENQIGLMNSIPIAVLLTFNIFIGRLADRASDWRQVIVWGALVSGITSIGLFWATGFVPILFAFALTSIAQAMIVPVADAAGLHLMSKTGGSLGAMRGLSTVGYMFGLLVSGFLIGKFGAWLFVPLFVGFSLLRAGGAMMLPLFKLGMAKQATATPHRFRNFLEPALLLPLLGWAIVYATHLVLNGFQSLLWSQQGYGTTAISLLIAVGALSEAIAFFLFQRVENRLITRWIILASGVITVLRWVGMAQEPSVVWLVLLQLLHGITFAFGFLACVNFIGRKIPVSAAAEAQSFFLVLQQIAAIIVISAFSLLAGSMGSGAFWGNAAMALVGTLVIIGGFRFQDGKST